jgi:hypothetical protein
MPSAAFVKFWRTDRTRDCFLSYVAKEDCQNLRLVCHNFSTTVAPHLLTGIKLSFDINSFTRLARMAALERIGYHVRTFSFHMPHTPDTFLAPLLDPVTGEEQTFLYEPSLGASRPSSSTSRSSTPKYGTREMNDLLVKQYPPIFHAATNISSFIRAFDAMPFLRHLQISCPGRPSGQRYRRDAIDYALISLRIALERVVLPDLDTLSLKPIHPAAVLYLRPQLGIGAPPASTKRWHNIKTLAIEMDSFEFGPEHPSDHLKILHTYLKSLPSLESLSFQWVGSKGPSPLSLHTEPCIVASRVFDCSRACPKSGAKPPLAALKFRYLKCMLLKNVTVDAVQISEFIMLHRKVLHEFEYEVVHLRSGNWDDALAPLTRISGNEDWKMKQEEVRDVPLIFNPETLYPEEYHNDIMWKTEMKRRPTLRKLQQASLKILRQSSLMLNRKARQ